LLLISFEAVIVSHGLDSGNLGASNFDICTAISVYFT